MLTGTTLQCIFNFLFCFLTSHRHTQWVHLNSQKNRHTHWDHAGGNEELKKLYPNVHVYGSTVDSIPALTDAVRYIFFFNILFFFNRKLQ